MVFVINVSWKCVVPERGRSVGGVWIFPVTIQISRMWVLGKGLQSPEGYQIGHMMNQVLLNYLIHLMLDISCYLCTTDDRSKLRKCNFVFH